MCDRDRRLRIAVYVYGSPPLDMHSLLDYLGACHMRLQESCLGAYPGVGVLHSCDKNQHLGAYPGVGACPYYTTLFWLLGRLTSIKDFMRVNFSLVWDPPFSLDLTNTDPNIIYCVDVYNHSCTSHHHLISDCSKEEAVYPYNPHQEIGLLEYVITPRSNAESAINGTPSVLRGWVSITVSDSVFSPKFP